MNPQVLVTQPGPLEEVPLFGASLPRERRLPTSLAYLPGIRPERPPRWRRSPPCMKSLGAQVLSDSRDRRDSKPPYQKITFKQDPYATWFQERSDPAPGWRFVGPDPRLSRLQRHPGFQLMFPGPEQVIASPEPSLEISDRVNLLLDLVGEAHVVDALRPLETAGDRENWVFRFVEERPATLREYIAFLTALNQMYQLFLSVLRVEYFVNVWAKSKALEVSPTDELRVVSINKNSPESVTVEGLAAGLKAVGEALSVGDQLQKIRTAGVKVDEAKLEL
jgi:hypothetical protein